MIDDLLGRSELKERINELETKVSELQDKRDRLEERLQKADKRRKEAVRERQEAAEQINRMEDRIAQLQGEVDRLSDDSQELYYRGRKHLSKSETEAILDRWMTLTSQEESVVTAAIVNTVPDELRQTFGKRSALLSRAAPCVAVADEDGLLSAAFSPPIQPEPFVEWDNALSLDRSWFLPTGEYTFALVRSDLFAMAEYRGDEQLSVTGFTSDVMGDHSKGGFSQGRFERRREEQRTQHLNECQRELSNRQFDRLILVGEQSVLGNLDVDPDTTTAVDATGSPEEALKSAYHDFWMTNLYLI